MKRYKMRDKETGATIVTTDRYLICWLARGFELLEILEVESADTPELEENTNL